MRKRLCAARKAMYAGIGEKKKSGFECAGKKKKEKSCANGGCVGMLSSSSEK